MRLALRYRDRIQGMSFYLLQELEQLVAGIRAVWDMEHRDSGQHGPVLNVINTGTTPGLLKLWDKAGSAHYLWVDTTGDLRISLTAPTSTSDTSGTVVGTQS